MAQQDALDPLKELRAVQRRMNKLFESAMGVADFDAPEEVDSWSPVSDVYETREALVVCLELPGIEQEQIDVRVDGDELVVCGERAIDREQAGEQFHRVERPYGKFLRRFRLPSTVDRGAVLATLRDGLLRITLPRRNAAVPEAIRVSIR